MASPRVICLAASLLAAGCASDTSTPMSDAEVGAAATDVALDPDAALDVGLDADAEPEHDGAADGSNDAPAEVDAGPLPVSQFTFEITTGDETRTLIDTTFEGYEANVFGAEVYAQVLKVWGSYEDVHVGIYFRTVDNPLPGSAQPGIPGSGAWVSMLHGKDAVYSTQMLSGGDIVIETCPAAVGDMVRGRVEGVRIYDLLTGAVSTLDGTFEVVLGSLAVDAVCSEL